MKRIAGVLLNYFFKGVLVVVPLGAAIFLIYWIISSVDKALNLSNILGFDEQGRPIYIPGLGILTVIVIILAAGIIVTNFVTDPIKAALNRWMRKIPLLNFFYSSIKDFTEAFVGDEKKFSEPVLVELNDSGLKQVGFVTHKNLKRIKLTDEVAVYLPFSYSFAGQLVIVKSDRVTPLNMTASAAMKFVVSGGVSGLSDKLGRR
ncbi:DUF502 domain-containing protein [Paradesertivirga mongoliensis]|uniref:DUF502 domain-containing protein n=1 Tax=Paradesertivirga mongoliensis TaxID=2100740 RepID=A0ABW4ZP85_9SPHI|nr:DUF502 domain-containing protein [Pedobacter mongoliensis]